jgi:2-polyprenyl-6-methoxyphenol hydroxylase-like FAD-dependent oxidoreductase
LLDVPLDVLAERYGSSMLMVHRGVLHTALLEAYGRDRVQLGAEVTGFRDLGARVRVILRNGEAVEGDLLLGADGLRSAVRRQFLADGDPVYLGSTAWRSIGDARRAGLPSGRGINWWGRGAEFLAFPLADGCVYWAGAAVGPGPAGVLLSRLPQHHDGARGAHPSL